MMPTRRRLRWVAVAAAVVGLIGALLLPQTALGADVQQPGGQTAGMISFALPSPAGRVITPNALNYARPGTAGTPLLLFLPATRAVPADYREFLQTASGLGYHVLSLDYWNRGKSLVRTCVGDPDCYTNVQWNRFNGSHPTAFSDIHPDDSILSRLRTALDYLKSSDPSGGWSSYSTGEHIHWNRIILAGHSQGGGQAAFIAHHHRAHGVLMFSSPVQSDNGVPASWMAHPGKTPTSAMYGFVNRNDVYFHNIVGSWAALGLGTLTDTDHVPHRAGVHGIVSARPLGTPGESHARSVSDATPRTADGVPDYEPIWKWMLEQVH